MCGIVGLVDKSQSRLDPSVLDAAINSMFQRGPDDGGLCRLEDQGLGVQGIVGHRRLSILDISEAGHQPMSFCNEQLTVVYNGEIYNYREIRSELMGFGYQFKSHCDTEVILAAYDKWGEEFIHRCNGMFAIAIWDGVQKKLLLYRDRIGIKPLYYGFQDGTFYFGSVLSAIAHIEGFQKKICNDAILAYTWLGYVPGPYSMFEGIEKLQPGHLAELDFRTWTLKARPYWQLAEFALTNENELPARKMEDYIDELEALLADAVRMRLISDVPLGGFLSGGIDSSVVVAMMQAHHSGTTQTFSIGFDVEEFNEAPAAKAIARHLGTEHHERILSSEDIKQVFTQIPEVFDEPFSDSSCLPTMLLSQMARDTVTVALSGDGGDELFFGDYHHYMRAKHWGYVSWIPKNIRKMLSHLLVNVPHRYCQRVSEALKCDHFGDYHCLIQAILQLKRYPIFRQSDLNRIMRFLPVNIVALRMEHLQRPYRQKATTLDFYSLLLDDFLVKVDRASMAHSLEVRVPLLDHRIVEFSRKVPFEILFYKKRHKHLLREVLGKYVPPRLWDRPKKGFSVPLAKWFRTDLYEYLRENLLDGGGVVFDLYDQQIIEKMLSDHLSKRCDNHRILWGLLSLVLWGRKHIVS
jgi:asparagine synthase (glutamine-hydrolysing)